MTQETEDKLANARAQAKAQFESIKEMVDAWNAANDSKDDNEAAEQTILEDALSVEVRSGWYAPGSKDADTKPAEYRILLCTGGPAVQIVGDLSEHGEPESARLQCQDWFTPWIDLRPCDLPNDSEEILLTYAHRFYFGE